MYKFINSLLQRKESNKRIIEKANVLVNDSVIVGVGDYHEADRIIDVSGKYICPSFIDSHIHIESTMLTPSELAKVCVPHGTGAIVADPHEIANVCGVKGVDYILSASEGLPMAVFIMMPSCVPATPFDESGAVLDSAAIKPYYNNSRVLGLAEMMNYPGVMSGDTEVMQKIQDAKGQGRIINGHAPLLSGTALDSYIGCGITDDHECSQFDEAAERIRKGQRVMIREGTSAKNLEALIGLFDAPYNTRCLLATDDKHPYDLMHNGHIDAVIRKAVKLKKSAIVGIQMATIQTAEYYGLKGVGAVASGYTANLLILDDLDTVDICDVYYQGKCVAKNKETVPFSTDNKADTSAVYGSFRIKQLSGNDFMIKPESKQCRVIRAIAGELLTEEHICEMDFEKHNGIDTERDIIKVAVCERHHMSGHIGLGFIEGLGIKNGAIASSVSHDSHNLIIAGSDANDMAAAGNAVAEMGGGLAVVQNGKVIAKMALPIAGLMSEFDAVTVAEENSKVRQAVQRIGAAEGIEPFMNLAFISLPVIPSLKMTTQGLVDVDHFTRVSLFV